MDSARKDLRVGPTSSGSEEHTSTEDSLNVSGGGHSSPPLTQEDMGISPYDDHPDITTHPDMKSLFDFVSRQISPNDSKLRTLLPPATESIEFSGKKRNLNTRQAENSSLESSFTLDNEKPYLERGNNSPYSYI